MLKRAELANDVVVPCLVSRPGYDCAGGPCGSDPKLLPGLAKRKPKASP